MCEVLDYMLWAGLQRKEMKLKLSCVLDSSPICLTKVMIKLLMIKLLMIIYYRYSLAVAVNIFETDRSCLVKMCLKCSDGIFIPKYMYYKSTNFILINIRKNK